MLRTFQMTLVPTVKIGKIAHIGLPSNYLKLYFSETTEPIEVEF